MEDNTVYVGLDVHKKTIEVGLADTKAYEARHYGRISNDPEQVASLARKLGGDGRRLHFCYEAGPTGYGVYRQIRELGHECIVVAPNLIPKRAGDRVKTDRRDCLNLARLYRAGELESIWVPDEAHEAMRDLIRTWLGVRKQLSHTKARCTHFLLRHGQVYPAASGGRWGAKHKDWIRRRRFDEISQQLVLEDYLQEVERQECRCRFLEQQVREHARSWSLYPQVVALQALRGISTFSALVLSAEIGSITRFCKAKQLVSYAGLGVREYSSGESVRRGGLTKSGNGNIRWVLSEAAWAYKRKPAGKKDMIPGISPQVREIAWRAQHRLHKKYWHEVNKGKISGLAATAVARELVGFAWEIAWEAERAKARPA